MYIEDLLSAFQKITYCNYPELNTEEFLSKLRAEIEKKKYDLQDQTIIERILKEDSESFSESFYDLLEAKITTEKDKYAFFNNENGFQSVIELFIKSVEHSIDYFYNDIISKQFSGK